MNFDIVLPTHFTTPSRNPRPHVLIEQALQQLAGGAAEGAMFRRNVLMVAGWRRGGQTPFARFPDEAAAAFNRVREVLAQTTDTAMVLESLEVMP